MMFFLQKSDLVKRSYATVLNANVIFNGARFGNFMEVDKKSLAEFLEECYKKSNVDPKDVKYLETHGCGIKVPLKI